MQTSVNDLFVRCLVYVLQVRNVQGAHSFDGHHQRFISTTVPSYVLSRGPQDTEDLRPIKSLPFTMLAEAHGVPHPGRIPPILKRALTAPSAHSPTRCGRTSRPSDEARQTGCLAPHHDAS